MRGASGWGLCSEPMIVVCVWVGGGSGGGSVAGVGWSTWTGRTPSPPPPIMVLCVESDADSTLLAISQLATHHYAPCEMWRAPSGLQLKPSSSSRTRSL